jgi:hypothetical protein
MLKSLANNVLNLVEGVKNSLLLPACNFEFYHLLIFLWRQASSSKHSLTELCTLQPSKPETLML